MIRAELEAELFFHAPDFINRQTDVERDMALLEQLDALGDENGLILIPADDLAAHASRSISVRGKRSLTGRVLDGSRVARDAVGMDQPEAVSPSDRTMMIGVLATLSAAFTGGIRDSGDAVTLIKHMMQRYRADLGSHLGRAPSEFDCQQALEQQVHRLRVSIGEYS
jgi:hypothetical protein